MAMRQYIGARYVTKIYENSLDPSSPEWESGVEYEPLTLVTYLNSSYLSKKQVGISVGNPADNPSYWAQTGFYNGQIAQLQNDVASINNDITDLHNDINDVAKRFVNKNRKWIVITDSYGEYLNGNGKNFIDQAFSDLGITDYYGFVRGGAAFSQTGYYNFLTVLTDNESAIADKTTITDILVAGGANDQSLTLSDIPAGIAAFMAHVKSNYPNANVHIGHFTHGLNIHIDKLVDTINYYKNNTKFGYDYVTNSEYIMGKMSFYTNDNVHPSSAGVDALSKYLIQFLEGGVIDVYETAENCFASADTSVFTIGLDRVKFIQHNNIVTIIGQGAGTGIRFNYISPLSLNAGLNLLADVLKVTDGFFYDCTGNINIRLDGLYGSNPDWCPAAIYANTMAMGMTATAGFQIYAPSALSGLSTPEFSISNESFEIFS